MLKHARPVNGVIKLYCYETGGGAENTTDKIILKPSRHEINNPEVQARKNGDEKRKEKEDSKQKLVDEAPPSKFCCC